MDEHLRERNFIENDLFILSDKKGTRWIVDEEDFIWARNYLWTNNGSGYATTIEEGNVKVYLHRKILITCKSVDHVDRNPFNNRRNNLRDGANGIQGLNKSFVRGASGVRGISKKRNKWNVIFTINKKKIRLGVYDKLEDAKLALLNYVNKHELKEFYLNE